MRNSLLIKKMKIYLMLLGIFSSLMVSAQTRITGKVIGADDKRPVIGASVKVQGTQTGTQTDADGNFSINASSSNILVVSYLGYTTKTVAVGSNKAINISLQPASNNLNEVVVTGYTTQRKKDITGAVATVNMTDAKKIPVTSSEQLLQGQASGVTVINQGAPGASSTVLIRGVSNFGNTSPLYVVDGVQTNSISQLNPNDIASISVLKDAGAAAIYGVSGGNGVIVVTTKKGVSGKTVLSYDAYYGVQTPLSGNVWHLMNPTQQSQLAFLANDASSEKLYPGGAGTLPTYGYHGASNVGTFGSSGVTNDPAILQYYHFDAANPSNDFLVQKFNQAGTDWFHQIFKNAPEQSHTITASGGTDKSSFLYSLNYLNQQGTLIQTYEKRYTARVNNTFSVLGNHVRFGENGYVFYRENNGGSSYNQQQEGGSIAETYRAFPIVPVYDIAGNYGGAYAGPGGEQLGNATNPYAQQQRTLNDKGRTWNMQGTVFAEADFLKYFTARTAFSGNAGTQFYNSTGYNQYENYEYHNSVNSYTEGSLYYYNYNFTNTLQYRQTIGKHNITAFAGYELKENGGQQLQAYATNFFTLDPNYLTAGTTTLPTSINLNLNNATQLFQPTSTQSVFGRVDYSYADKYILGATIRRDGFSSFFPGRQYGTFPSVSLGWRIAQENFLKNVKWLNELKLRGSYGSAGSNANIGGVNAIDTYRSGFGTSYYGINGGVSAITPGFYQASIGNPKTTWETDKILNIGIDASLFNHLDLDLEYYQKKISGLLFQLPLPSTVGGAAAPYVNIGDVQNKGFDIAATYHGAVGNDFKFSIGTNITTYKNKITNLPAPGYFDVGSSRDNNIVREQVGMPIGSFFGYKTMGIYQNAAQLASLPGYSKAAVGSFIYQDTNGDGKIDANDRTFIGNPNPTFTYGVNINASYKRFDFSMVLYGSQGNKDFNYVKYWTDFYGTFTGGKNIDLLTKSAVVVNNVVTNPDATLPSATFSQSLGSSTVSSFYVENGSFLKCRVASLGYTFDPGLLKSVGVSRLHVYVQATNLFTITKYSGLDPEIVPSVSNLNQSGNQSAAFGIDYGAYPNNQKQYLLGVNLSF
ncbi:MAG: SusC/RagA family TonB-linked outer membrane protein [Janthinobacterium lividum]